MSVSQHVWFVDSGSALKRRVRIEVIGRSFALYEQQWRSEAYFFDDLVYRGKEGDSHVFGIADGIKDRPKWKLGFKGEIPPELASILPPAKPPLLSNVGMLVIGFLCLAIVYFAVT
ncbi:hypothetical protein [Sphingorhabdus sp. SMR4y]|uniref:hypothetical protein n=1 Tax=Sphingorhabdus sp. SMR4y TaxID=2584094 RepID=UPI000B5C943F|nr:hypothetical protein [Sphingorhabdus sp. SMR4y]ASK89931.1 peptidase [Sphingorhabdus sp. SMR4y]